MREPKSEDYKKGYKSGYSAGRALCKKKQKAIGGFHNPGDLVVLHHAYWVGTQYDGYADGSPVWDYWECSRCHTSEYESDGEPPRWAFCPDCGALMDKDPQEVNE